jgi:hypothetical protein
MDNTNFKIGDKVNFKYSSKKAKTNKQEGAFCTLQLPRWVFRAEGEIVGFHQRYKWMRFLGPNFGRDKGLPIVQFTEVRSSSEKELDSLYFTIYGSSRRHDRTSFIVPCTMLKIAQPESNHPLTSIFL